jgi:DNA-binding transcriptional ArsR family regulator
VEQDDVVDALAALAHPSRLGVFRLLVQAGPGGMAAGTIGEKLGLPPATLSFHLSHLSRAGLVSQKQAGRFVIYSADFANMTQLVAFLTENCCGGRACVPATRARRRA